MGLFDRFKKTERDIAKEEIVEVPWHMIMDISQLEEIEKESLNKPIAIFKHSTRCGISRTVLRIFEKTYDLKEEKIKLYFLDLLQYRGISNEIANRFGVPHESPQLIVIKDGKAIYDASHQGVDAETLHRFVTA